MIMVVMVIWVGVMVVLVDDEGTGHVEHQKLIRTSLKKKRRGQIN